MKAFVTADLLRKQDGQILLIVVLTMVVALTIGLGVVSRSIVQVKTAKDQGDSQKAFSAAEAGVEQALNNSLPITGEQLGNNATVSNVTISSDQSPELLLNNGTPLVQDDGADVWLADYPNYTNPWTGRMRVFWGSTANGCNEAALEVIVISRSNPFDPSNPYTMQHYGFDPCSGRASGNNFSAAQAGGLVNTTTFSYSAPVDISQGLIARVIPLYTNTTVGIIGYKSSSPENPTNYNPFSPQGKVITSTGTAGSTEREIIYFQGYNQLPSELFYSLFSPQ